VDNPLYVGYSNYWGDGGWGDFCLTFYFEGNWGVKVGECVKKNVNNPLNVEYPTICVMEGEGGNEFIICKFFVTLVYF